MIQQPTSGTVSRATEISVGRMSFSGAASPQEPWSGIKFSLSGRMERKLLTLIWQNTLFAMVNFHCQYHWIWKHLGDSFLSMVLRKFLQRSDCEGKTQPKRGQDHLMDLAPQLNEKEERENWATTLVGISLPPDWRPSALAACDWLPQFPTTAPSCELSGSWNLPFLLQVACVGTCITAMGKATNALLVSKKGIKFCCLWQHERI